MPNVDLPERHSAFGILHYTNVTILVLATLFLAAHLAFLPASLEDLDSINFALGMRHFDVAHHQPHPPGYPLFILAAKAARTVASSEARALGLVSVIAGALSVLALFALFLALEPDPMAGRRAALATLVAVTAPLYWFTASRPLSDMPGLAAAVAVQALTLMAPTPLRLASVSFLAGFAAGIRSQVAWLTVPLLALTIARRPRADRARTAAMSLAAFMVGGLTWGIPLIVLTGGPRAYWHAVFDQGAEDLTGIQMLSTTPTVRQLALALYNAFVVPWAFPPIAVVIIVLALAGTIRLLRRDARPALLTLTAAFVPYFVFNLLFQETVTTRYALPLVPPMAYLAVRALSRFLRAWMAALIVLAFISVNLAWPAVVWYSRVEAPAFRLLGDMQAIASRARKPPLAPVLAMHRREDLDLRRPMLWMGDALPRFSQRLPAPPQHEWLEAVKYWNAGGRDEVWFVADPARTDLALFDRPPGRTGTYRWLLPFHSLVGGVRPDVMDWHRIRHPGWYLGEGWALTPETAGVAAQDGRGPGRAPIEGWIRRRHEELRLMVGGRNLWVAGPPAHVRIAVDGRVIDEPVVPPGFFLRMLMLPAGALDGDGDYATITVSADTVNVAIEQFDAQSADRVMFGFGEGWHESEFNPATGPWRWTSDRAVLRVHAAGRPLTLTLRGQPPVFYLWRPARIRVSAGGRVVAEQTLFNRFFVQAHIPAELVAGDESTITIETDQTDVPAERRLRRTPDRRRLGLRVFECDLRPAAP